LYGYIPTGALPVSQKRQARLGAHGLFRFAVKKVSVSFLILIIALKRPQLRAAVSLGCDNFDALF
jgi:hypothetical protein